MSNPRAIRIECDGAMDYDTKQRGGNGFVIKFPDIFELEPIVKAIRNDGQGIHRLEMISLIEAMLELLAFAKADPELIQKAEAVELYTDRESVTDDTQTNRYKIREWRKNKWKNYEGKDVKNSDLLDKIDKTRIKLEGVVRGGVSIRWIPRKQNRTADKLSKAGKITDQRGRKLLRTNRRQVVCRIFDGSEIKYENLKPGDTITARLYSTELINKQYEACFEICSEKFTGQILKVSVEEGQKTTIHKHHFYIFDVENVLTHHITAKSFREVKTQDTKNDKVLK